MYGVHTLYIPSMEEYHLNGLSLMYINQDIMMDGNNIIIKFDPRRKKLLNILS